MPDTSAQEVPVQAIELQRTPKSSFAVADWQLIAAVQLRKLCVVWTPITPSARTPESPRFR